MENNLTTNKKIALTGVLSALVIVLGITKLGLIPLGPIASISILQIPVILAVILGGLPSGLFVGATFGIMSLIQAAMSPSGVLDPLFVNPLISVLPRMLIAVIAYFLWKLFDLIKLPKLVNVVCTAVITTLCHTLLVIGSLYLFSNSVVKEAMGGAGYFAAIGILGIQAILEAIASGIISFFVYFALFLTKNRKSKMQKLDEKQ